VNSFLYLDRVPVDVPDGYRLVHNVLPGRSDRRSGQDGFRYWLEHSDDNDRRAVCACEWNAPGHYGVVRELHDSRGR
jgi:hypothetical protein